MDASFQQTLLEDRVYALPVFSVESLYYSPELFSAVAMRQSNVLGFDPQATLKSAKTNALSMINKPGNLEHLAARVAERRMRDEFLRSIPTRAEMVASGDLQARISIESPYPKVLERIRELASAGDIDSIIAAFPVRESGILRPLAQELRFINEDDYEKAARAVIMTDSAVASKIKDRLGELTSQLTSQG